MYKIIFVDDEIWALKGIQNIIDWGMYGFEIINTYVDPYEAADGILTLRPDAIFTDIRMEEISGLDLLKKTREAGGNSEFVFVSAYSDFDAAREALEYGAFHYLLKPLDESKVIKLAQRLFKYLENKKDSTSVEYMGIEELANRDWTKLSIAIGVRSYCYVIVLDSIDLMLELTVKHTMLKTIMLNSGIKMILVTSKEKLNKSFEVARENYMARDIGFGYSRERFSFDDCETMFCEAELSMLNESPLSSNNNVVNAQNYILKHYKNKISLKDISKALFLSDTYLCEIFKRHTGKTISSYISELRMKKAAKLIISSEFSLQEVARNVGYSNYAYFGRVFKQHFNLSPEKYRMKKENALNA